MEKELIEKKSEALDKAKSDLADKEADRRHKAQPKLRRNPFP